MTQKFRKKPVEVEAMQVTEQNMLEVADWCGGHLTEEFHGGEICLAVPRNHLGEVRVKAGDWVVHRADDSFGSEFNEIFAATYEPVETADG